MTSPGFLDTSILIYAALLACRGMISVQVPISATILASCPPTRYGAR